MEKNTNFVKFNEIYDYVKSYCEAEELDVPAERTVRSWLDNRNLKQTVWVNKKGFDYDWSTSSEMLKLDHNIDINYIKRVIDFSGDTDFMDNWENVNEKYNNNSDYKKIIDNKVFEMKKEIFMRYFLAKDGLSFDDDAIVEEVLSREANPDLFEKKSLAFKSLLKKASD